MSRGSGAIERKIGDLFASSHDRALDADEVVRVAFALDGAKPTRAMRVSAIRAAHRLIKRLDEMEAEARRLVAEAWKPIDAVLPEIEGNYDNHTKRSDAFHATPQWKIAERLFKERKRIGVKVRFYRREGAPHGHLYAEDESWRATLIGKGRKARLVFHLPDVPPRVWAVSIDRSGVHWFDAEVVRVTERNVIARYGGEVARLDRKRLWQFWAWWRGVMFVSSRSGRIAAQLDELWRRRYGRAEGGPPPAMRMPLAEAIALLGVPANYTRADVIAAFRRKAKTCHPDLGGSAEAFQKLVEARDRLLTSLGEKATEAPAYYPSGATIVWRATRSSGAPRLGAGGQRLLR
jgi:hypothetical protein